MDFLEGLLLTPLLYHDLFFWMISFCWLLLDTILKYIQFLATPEYYDTSFVLFGCLCPEKQ